MSLEKAGLYSTASVSIDFLVVIAMPTDLTKAKRVIELSDF